MIAAYLKLVRAVVSRWPWWAIFVSAAMLATAHSFERFGGLAPCLLCLKQREVYWTAMAIAAVAIAAGFAPKGRLFVRLLCAALALTFLVGAGIALWHTGAEWKWWPGPAACAAGKGEFSADGLSDLLAGVSEARPSCDVALWHFLGLSMAGWNVLISAKLAVLSVLAAIGFGDRK